MTAPVPDEAVVMVNAFEAEMRDEFVNGTNAYTYKARRILLAYIAGVVKERDEFQDKYDELRKLTDFY